MKFDIYIKNIKKIHILIVIFSKYIFMLISFIESQGGS